MKNEKPNCLVWTLLFLGLAGASGWFVFRRSPTPGSALFGGLAGGILLIIALSWLGTIPGRIADWLRIVSARMGSEPRDGKRVALIGTLRAHGELLTPFSRERCVLYAYEIVMNVRSGKTSSVQRAYEGFAMVPLTIEHGAERTRILAKPELELKATQPKHDGARAHAQTFIETAHFVAPSKDEKDMSHGDGSLRYDYFREPRQEKLRGAALQEKFLRAETNVCALGTWSADRRALLAPVTLRTGRAFGIGAAWRVVNAAIGAAIFASIALIAAAIFCVNFPLDAAEHARPGVKLQWWEIDLERFVDRHLRLPMHEAGMISTPGFYLQEVCEGCAKGTLEIDGRVIELKHAAYTGGRSVHLSARPGDRDGVTLDDGKVVLTIGGKSANVPQSWLQSNDVETSLGADGDYAGRITVVAPDRWIRCRVHFHVRVDGDAWLR